MPVKTPSFAGRHTGNHFKGYQVGSRAAERDLGLRGTVPDKPGNRGDTHREHDDEYRQQVDDIPIPHVEARDQRAVCICQHRCGEPAEDQRHRMAVAPADPEYAKAKKQRRNHKHDEGE